MEKSPPPPYSAPNAYPQPGFQPPPMQGAYPPPAGAYPPPAGAYPVQPGNTVVMVAAPTIPVFGPDSTVMTCPYCHHQITSRVESEAATKTHLFALILCLFGCIPCCLIPYCTDSCQNRNHYCPSCGAFLGAYTN